MTILKDDTKIKDLITVTIMVGEAHMVNINISVQQSKTDRVIGEIMEGIGAALKYEEELY